MKKTSIILLVTVLVVSGTCFYAIAASKPGMTDRGFGKHHGHRGFALALLTKYQAKNLAAQTLAEMTGESIESVNQMFTNRSPRVVMEESGIDKEVFRTNLHAKIEAMVKQATANGSITPEQEEEILSEMVKRSQRRQLMRQLISNGVEDGTITEEQAQRLLSSPKHMPPHRFKP